MILFLPRVTVRQLRVWSGAEKDISVPWGHSGSGFLTAKAAAREIVCPGREYLDLCADGEGQVYATYQDSQGRQNILARVQYQNRKLSGKWKSPLTDPCGPAGTTGCLCGEMDI